MQVHLSKIVVEVLRQQAMESLKLDDGGESFAEEALSRLSEDDILLIEDGADAEAGDFLLDVFVAWDPDEDQGIIDTLGSMLEDLDIELTYDDDDEENESDAWDDDDIDEDEGEELAFEGY